MSDIKAYDSIGVDDAIEFILKQIARLYDTKIISAYKEGLPATPTLQQFAKEFARKHGTREDLTLYVFESIAYGLEWISGVSSVPKPDKIKSIEDRLQYMAEMYYIMGGVVSQIKGKHNDKYLTQDYYYCSKNIIDSFKSPVLDIEEYKNEDLTYIRDLDWNEVTGLGLFCGQNEIRAIDIDNLGCFEDCTYEFWSNPRGKKDNDFDKFVDRCLELLHLPKDYEWVVRSGSGHGLHIIFKCKDIPGVEFKTPAFPSIKEEDNLEFDLTEYYFCYKKNVEPDFRRLELIWNGHIAVPPTIGRRYESFERNTPYEPNHNKYSFINTKGYVPAYEPCYVKSSYVNDLLNVLCGRISSSSHEYSECFKCYSQFLFWAKLENSHDSMGGFHRFKDDIQWLESCDSPEGLNSLGVKYVEKKEYEKAVNCFIQSGSVLSTYNLAVMKIYGYIGGADEEISRLVNRCLDSRTINDYNRDYLLKIWKLYKENR